MKHSLASPIGLFCASVLVFLCGPSWSQTGSLNAAPSHPALAKTPGIINIAVINMKNASGVSSGETEVITDRLRGELFNTGKVNVMERDQMQEILKEQGFQQSGACTNEACMVEIGQLLGVERLVTGSLGKVGSMFLVNLRVIDVKTAKIMKVVSVDIKGDLDEVVAKLPGVASQLVASEAPAQTEQPAALEKKAEPKKPVETVSEKKEEPVQAKAPEVADERAEKNKNRFGIRVGMNLFGANITRIYHLKEYDPSTGDLIGDTTYNFDENSAATITRTPLINYYLKGVLKAGRYITIDIGGGYSGEQTTYDWDLTRRVHSADIYSLPSLGVNFTKRWYPLKINVGLMADFNILDYSIVYYSRDYTTDPFTRDTSLSYVTFNAGFGFRTGLEIMAGRHVGFNVDFVYYYSHFDTFTQHVDDTDASGTITASSDRQWSLTMPPIALGLGVSVYF